MKRSYIILFTVLFAISLSSCRKELLDTTPYSSVSSQNIWATENLAELAMNGVYNALLLGSCDDQGNGQANFMGRDVFVFGSFDASISARNNWSSTWEIMNGNATPSSGMFSYAWKQFYEGVARANDVIGNIGSVESMSVEKRARYMAEAKFLRAFFYYRLNALYRGVPLYTEPTELADYNKPRSSEAEVWSQIINDLTDAINEPNLPGKYAAGDGNYGRITKGAAYALRGKTYLWLKDYAKAEADFKAVGPLGYNLFQGDYQQLFKEANEQCDEMVFSIQCFEQSGYGNRMSFRYGSRLTRGSCWDDYFGSTDFIDTYECIDGKPFNWEDFIPGYTSMTPEARSVYFCRDHLNGTPVEGITEANQTTLREFAVNYGADMSKYLNEGNEARLSAAYANRDPRLQKTFVVPNATYLGSPSGDEHLYTLRWPFFKSDESEPFDLRSDDQTKLHYMVRKFVSEGNELEFRAYSPIDVPIIRYADVLLNLAEALNEQGKTQEAIPYVNQVRERVGLAALGSNQYTQVSGQDNLRERIRNERRWEFAAEGVTYFDELRWGTWFETVNYPGNGRKECTGKILAPWSSKGDYYSVWAIPVTERQLNSELTQNPGWID
ncbi:MAG: RagB/SusD family nutrient uptake outer membrane protein [Bacteroidales bacterium]|nr:RagB/SusD family nutrient uptake outer membrane protein [Bacteroidales bacterium]